MDCLTNPPSPTAPSSIRRGFQRLAGFCFASLCAACSTHEKCAHAVVAWQHRGVNGRVGGGRVTRCVRDPGTACRLPVPDTSQGLDSPGSPRGLWLLGWPLGCGGEGRASLLGRVISWARRPAAIDCSEHSDQMQLRGYQQTLGPKQGCGAKQSRIVWSAAGL